MPPDLSIKWRAFIVAAFVAVIAIVWFVQVIFSAEEPESWNQ